MILKLIIKKSKKWVLHVQDLTSGVKSLVNDPPARFKSSRNTQSTRIKTNLTYQWCTTLCSQVKKGEKCAIRTAMTQLGKIHSRPLRESRCAMRHVNMTLKGSWEAFNWVSQRANMTKPSLKKMTQIWIQSWLTLLARSLSTKRTQNDLFGRARPWTICLQRTMCLPSWAMEAPMCSG